MLGGRVCRTRLVSLAAQKFVTGIAVDALELQKQKRTAPQQKLKDQGYNIKDKRHVLSMVEIAEALQEVTCIVAASNLCLCAYNLQSLLLCCSTVLMPSNPPTIMTIKPHESTLIRI